MVLRSRLSQAVTWIAHTEDNRSEIRILVVFPHSFLANVGIGPQNKPQ
jgi:hypothetical protein